MPFSALILGVFAGVKDAKEVGNTESGGNMPPRATVIELD